MEPEKLETTATPVSDSSSPVANGGAVRPDRRSHSERRAHTRYLFTTTAEIVELQTGTRITARTSDLSLGGCYVDTPNAVPRGTVFKLRLTRERRTFEAQAVVTCSQIGMGMGLRFTNVEESQSRVLNHWLAQLRGESPNDFGSSDQESQPDAALKHEQQYVLNELILALVRKGILSEGEGKVMLRRLLG